MAETTINNPQLPPNATKFYTHFLYKAVFVSIFILILPLFPSQAPDFINHKTINTTSWEFLQLVFVGIAVSYGLFSKRNDENHKEEASSSSSSFMSENAQSYVAGLLQVSSVFDDDSENPSASGSHDKVQTWNSQYYRGEPIVVVAKESDDATTVEKPLLLPVRSLKTGVSESSGIDSKVNSFSRSNSRRISRNLSKVNAEGSEENVVLRSPIPWRSRSGRMEVKEREDFSQTPSVHENSGSNPIESPFRYQFSKDFSQTPSVHDYSEANPIESPSFRYQFSKLSKQNLNPSSEDKIHPSSATLSSEIQSRSLEDVGRRKIIPKSTFSPTPPPPPPPPPPPRQQRTVNVNVNHTHTHTNTRSNTHVNKELKRNVRSVPEEFQNRGRRAAEFTIRSRSGASLKTRKESELEEYLSHDKEIERFIERRGSQSKKFMDEDEDEDDDDEMENPEEEKKELMKDLDDGEKVEEELGSIKNESDNGPDVDKKADEFIAKFREQIRLQRIASIRKSTAQR